MWPPEHLFGLYIFNFLPKNYFRWSHHICQKYSSQDSEKVLLFVETIQNSRRPPWPLIGRDILESFSRTFACQVNRACQKYSLWCCWSSERIEIPELYPGLWLAETWFTSPEQLRINSSDLPEMFTGVFSKCYYLKIDFKSKLADLVIWLAKTFYFSLRTNAFVKSLKWLFLFTKC